MPRRARSLNLPPRSTCITEPIAREPAGMATRSPTFTSRVTRASTRSSTRAVSLEIRFSVCRPITESEETTSSSNVFCGGSDARGVSCAARSSGRCAGVVLSAAAGVGVDGTAGACVAALLGQLLVRMGGCSCRATGRPSRLAPVRAGGSARLATVVLDTEPAVEAGVLDAVSATTLSVSWTACDGRSAVAVAGRAVAVVTGVGASGSGAWTWADAGPGTAFCLDAR